VPLPVNSGDDQATHHRVVVAGARHNGDLWVAASTAQQALLAGGCGNVKLNTADSRRCVQQSLRLALLQVLVPSSTAVPARAVCLGPPCHVCDVYP
jgi:hypothetical protein